MSIKTLMARIGTAGWSLPAKPKAAGTHLTHYSRTLDCAEINSTFYRMPRPTTWAKWAAETPSHFRFSIKAPKAITHEAKLRETEPLLKAFFEQIDGLQQKAGPVLFQLPPSLELHPAQAEDFLALLRTLYQGPAVVEPRHATWFTPDVNALLQKHKIARAAADPPKGSPEAAGPGGDTSLIYYRLHGSPRTYYSCYDDDALTRLAAKLGPHPNSWIIFDNTAQSHAYANALRLQQFIAENATSL